MHSSHSNAALVIVGHGSTVNPDSSTPTHQHAEVIRRSGEFAEVHCAFWKEEPSMREVFYAVRSEEVYIVPNFISEGYFTRQVLPRELNLDGPVTERGSRTFYYCDPVGIHPSMTRLLLHRADEAAPQVPRRQTTLIIVGHGTSLNENSRKAIEAQVALIREGGHGFAEVLDAYMEEAPFVAKWDELAASPHVVVVPFFIADGLHSYQDIPVLLGIESEPTAAASQNDVFRHNPHELRGKQLYYSSAVGTDALMSNVILDQVRDFDAKFSPAAGAAPAQERLALPAGPFVIGQIEVSASGASWLLHHVEDRERLDALTSHVGVAEARGIALLDDAGNFRGLHSAPNLRHGWKLVVSGEAELREAIEAFYPAALGLWEHQVRGTLQPVPLRQTLGRQTGMYRFANTISDDQAHAVVARECDAATKCQRCIAWGLTETAPLQGIDARKTPEGVIRTSEIPLICVEACTYIVSAAREAAKASHQSGPPA